jgi:6-phosphogluconolactonase (cycloisomerase 2 family)
VTTSWQSLRAMTPLQFERAAKALGMNIAAAGRFIGVSERTVRRIVAGEADIPASAAMLLRSMIHHGDTPVVPKWSRDQN